MADKRSGISDTSQVKREGGYFYQTNVYADKFVTTTLYNREGFEVHHDEGYMHPSEQSADTICRFIDRIEDEYPGFSQA